MKYSFVKTGLAGALAAAFAIPAVAGEITASVGLDYSTGDYGTDQTSEMWYVPVVGKYENGPLTLKLTVPWVRITDPGNAVGPDRVPLPGSPQCNETESGLGDVVGSVGYAVLDGTQGGPLVELIGKVKFPTADEDRCLGTGKTDYAVQVDVAQAFGAVTGFGTLGWRKFGDPSGQNFRDPIYASLGAAYKLAPATSLGASYDWRQKVSRRGDEISEATLFLNQKLTEGWKLQVYAVKGFSDASPDWGGGLFVSHSY